MAARAPRLLPHVLVAGALLVAVAWWVGAHGQVSVDEGVAVVQARTVADGSWTVDHPLASVDPDGSAFPLRHATRTDEGFVPFAKHPLYPALLSVADRLGGVRAMIGLSIAGALAAAVAAAALARRLDERLAVPALYAVALGSPLLFDASLVLAHALGAATAAAAAWAAVVHLESGRRWSRWLGLAVLAAVVTVLLRGEGVLLVAAATGVAALAAVLRRSAAAGRLAAAGALAAGLGLVVDRGWRDALLGDGQDLAAVPSSHGPWLSARWAGLRTITGQVGYGDDGHGRLLVVGILGLVVLAVLLRRGRPSRPIVAGAALAAVGLVALWVADVPASPVPGLLLAFPLLWFGLAAGRWVDHPLARGLAGVGTLFAVAVVLTQYDEAGGFEWGARYLALALPLVTPVALLGLRRALDAAPADVGRIALGALAAVTLLLGAAGAVVRRDLDRGADRLADAVLRDPQVIPSSHLGADDLDDRPIIVSTELAVPQALWPILDDARWLRIEDDPPPRGVLREDPRIAALRARRVDRFTLVTRDWEADRWMLGPVEGGPTARVGDWVIATITYGTASS